MIIGKLLDYDNLAIDYDPTLADPVKNKFNKDYQKEDLINYFKVWLKYLPKYPMTYINATINNVSSYFYPMKSKWKVYSKLNPKLPEAGYDYHFNKLQVGRDFLISYEVITEYSPVGIFINMGMISWLSIIVFISLCNKNKYYIFLLPNLISIIFCILSPANTYYRYIYPSLVLMTTLLPLIKVLGENKIIK